MADSLDVSERVGRQAKTKERKECLQKKKGGETKERLNKKTQRKIGKKKEKKCRKI